MEKKEYEGKQKNFLIFFSKNKHLFQRKGAKYNKKRLVCKE